MMTTSKDVGHHLEPKMKPIALWNFMENLEWDQVKAVQNQSWVKIKKIKIGYEHEQLQLSQNLFALFL